VDLFKKAKKKRENKTEREMKKKDMRILMVFLVLRKVKQTNE